MEIDVCEKCHVLRENAVAAITAHVKLGGSLEIAKVAYTKERVAELEPSVEQARVARERAVAEYMAHRESHASTANA